MKNIIESDPPKLAEEEKWEPCFRNFVNDSHKALLYNFRIELNIV